jgi:hypothetical protein
MFADAKKDQSLVNSLIRDILDGAKQHPSPQLWRSLALRLSSLENRVSIRLKNHRAGLPNPVHSVLPDHQVHSEHAMLMLEHENSSTESLLLSASGLLQQYQSRVEALDSLYSLLDEITLLSSKLKDIIIQLKGASGSDGNTEEKLLYLDLESVVCFQQDYQKCSSSLSNLSSEFNSLRDGYSAVSRRLQHTWEVLQECINDPGVIQSMSEKQKTLLNLQNAASEELEAAQARLIVLKMVQLWWKDLSNFHTQCLDIDSRLMQLVRFFTSYFGTNSATVDSTSIRSLDACAAVFSEADDAIVSLNTSLQEWPDVHLGQIRPNLRKSRSVAHVQEMTSVLRSWIFDITQMNQILKGIYQSSLSFRFVEGDCEQLLSSVRSLVEHTDWTPPARADAETFLHDDFLAAPAEYWSEAQRLGGEISEYLKKLQDKSTFFGVNFSLRSRDMQQTSETSLDLTGWPVLSSPISLSIKDCLQDLDHQNRRRFGTLSATLMDRSATLADKILSERMTICLFWVNILKGVMDNHLRSARDELQRATAILKQAQDSPKDRTLSEWQVASTGTHIFDFCTDSAFNKTRQQVHDNVKKLRTLSEQYEDVGILLDQLSFAKEVFDKEVLKLLEQASGMFKPTSVVLRHLEKEIICDNGKYIALREGRRDSAHEVVVQNDREDSKSSQAQI